MHQAIFRILWGFDISLLEDTQIVTSRRSSETINYILMGRIQNITGLKVKFDMTKHIKNLAKRCVVYIAQSRVPQTTADKDLIRHSYV